MQSVGLFPRTSKSQAHTHDETSNVLDDVGRISFATHSRVHCAREYVVEWPQREILDVANNTMVGISTGAAQSELLHVVFDGLLAELSFATSCKL